jgi:hypothetical protein
MVPERANAKKSFTFGCGDPAGCKSGRLGGWITQ